MVFPKVGPPPIRQVSPLHVIGWRGKFSPHATRATGSARLSELGYRPDWIERQLAHLEPNAVRRTCNQAGHFVDRAGMMQGWADLLDEWEEAAKARAPADSVVRGVGLAGEGSAAPSS